jgi:hypothetical protein
MLFPAYILNFTYLDPVKFALILAGFLTASLLLYLLKPRPRTVMIPFLPFFRKIVLKKGGNAIFRKSRIILSYIIQACLISLILLSLSDPVLLSGDGCSVDWNRPMHKAKVVIFIDRSASMAMKNQKSKIKNQKVTAGEETGTQSVTNLDLARDMAFDTVDELLPMFDIMLVSYASDISPLTTFTDNSMELEDGIFSIRQSESGSNIEDALDFLEGLKASHKDMKTIFITDGKSVDETAARRARSLQVSFLIVKSGEEGNNLSVSAFSMRRSIVEPARLDFLCTLKNYSGKQAKGTLFLEETVFEDVKAGSEPVFLEKGTGQQILGAIPFDVKPEGEESFRQSILAPSSDLIRARAEVNNYDDVLKTDNNSYSVIPPRQTLDVLLAGKKNLFIKAAFLLIPDLKVFESDSISETTGKKFDLTVTNGVPVPEHQQTGSFLFINPYKDLQGVSIINSPAPGRVKKEHPLMKNISLADVNISRATKVRAEKDQEILFADTGGNPLILSKKNQDDFSIIFAFDLGESDIILRYSFPNFILNLVDLLKGKGGQYQRNFITGQNEIIQRKNGKQISFIPEHAGFYAYSDGSELRYLAANFRDESESNLLSQPVRDMPGYDADSFKPSEVALSWLWLLFLIVAAVVTLIEWITYNRRITN